MLSSFVPRRGAVRSSPTVLASGAPVAPRTSDGRPSNEGTGASATPLSDAVSRGRVDRTGDTALPDLRDIARRERGRNAQPVLESFLVDVWAGLVGALVGLLVGPLADRLATNAPLHEPLLRRVPFSRVLPLVTAGTALLGGACGVAQRSRHRGIPSARSLAIRRL